jgi:hypothetical protein
MFYSVQIFMSNNLCIDISFWLLLVTFSCLLNNIKLGETYVKMTFMSKMMTIFVKDVGHQVQFISPKRLNKVAN